MMPFDVFRAARYVVLLFGTIGGVELATTVPRMLALTTNDQLAVAWLIGGLTGLLFHEAFERTKIAEEGSVMPE